MPIQRLMRFWLTSLAFSATKLLNSSAWATYIQIDAPHYGLLLDPKTRGFYEKLGWSLDQWLSLGIELDNAIIAGFPDVTFGFHI